MSKKELGGYRLSRKIRTKLAKDKELKEHDKAKSEVFSKHCSGFDFPL